MKVLLFIDSFALGGAQRQMAALAIMLKQSGVGVNCLAYHKIDFFLPLLEQAGIAIDYLQSRSYITRPLAFRRYVQSHSFDVVLAFLKAPSMYAEIAGLPTRKWGLVVSERSTAPDSSTMLRRIQRLFHMSADIVTTNSHANRELLERVAPFLRGRVMTIYNAVDLERFCIAQGTLPHDQKNVTLVVAARHGRVKNLVGVINAMKMVRAESLSAKVRLVWYGDPPWSDMKSDEHQALADAKRLIVDYGLQEDFVLEPATADIARRYQEADGLLQPSFYEGLPNSVCEAMACGKPILMSNVSDAPYLVEDGSNGFLFDPKDHRDIARAILKLARLTLEQRTMMGRRSREKAISLFDPQRFADQYLNACVLSVKTRRLPSHSGLPLPPSSVQAEVSASDCCQDPSKAKTRSIK